MRGCLRDMAVYLPSYITDTGGIRLEKTSSSSVLPTDLARSWQNHSVRVSWVPAGWCGGAGGCPVDALTACICRVRRRLWKADILLRGKTFPFRHAYKQFHCIYFIHHQALIIVLIETVTLKRLVLLIF